MNQKTPHSDRLIYRQLEESDFPFFSRLYWDTAVMRYTLLDTCESPEDAQKIFREVLDIWRYIHYIVIQKSENMLIGMVFYEIVHDHPHGWIAEIGFILKPESWNQWYATETGNAIISFLFDNTRIHKIFWAHHVDNTASGKILTKLGMKQEGIARSVRYKNNEWKDEVQYGLLREEYMR